MRNPADDSNPTPATPLPGVDPDRVLELFSAIVARPRAEHAAALDEACGTDVNLRGELESLLGHHADASVDDPLAPERMAGRAAFASEALEPPTEESVELPQRIGPFAIDGIIGQGGMGQVFSARQEAPRRRVALKVIRPGHISGRLRRRFQEEIDVLGRLQHPGIAQVFEAGETTVNGVRQPYIAMEFVDGQELQSWTREIPLRAQVDVLIEIARVVHYAHERGVIHRDLKPANILVTNQGQPKILDFGVARAIHDESVSAEKEEATLTGEIVGTLAYMSPEQLQGNRSALGFSSDVYALGVIAFEVLGGSLPHALKGRPLAELIEQVCRQRAPSLRALRADAPKALAHVVARALEKEPRDRYSSAAAFADDLVRWREHRPVIARPPSTLQNLSLFARRNPALSASVFLLIAALSAGVFVSNRFARRASDARAQTIREAEVVKRTAYRLALASAEIALRQHDAAEAESFLAQTEIGLRGWEWHHLASRLDESLASVETNPSQRLSLRAPLGARGSSPDEYHWLSYEEGDFVEKVYRPEDERFWELRKIARPASLDDSEQGLPAVSLLPSGTLLLLDRVQGVVREFRGGAEGTETQTPFEELPLLSMGPDLEVRGRGPLRIGRRRATEAPWILLQDAGRKVVFSVLDSSATQIAFVGIGASRTIIEVFDLRTGTRTHRLEGHPEAPRAVAFSPDGRYLAAALADGTLVEHDLSGEAPPRVLRGHADRVSAVAYSPDGRILASGSQDATVRLWTRDDDRPRQAMMGHRHEVMSLIFRDDRELMSIDASGSLRRWSLASHQAGVLRGHALYVYALALHDESQTLASGDWNGELRTWEARRGESRGQHDLRRSAGLYDILVSMAFLPDGERLAVTRGNSMFGVHRLEILDPLTGRTLQDLGPVCSLSALGVTRDPARLVVTGHGAGGLFAADDGRLIARFDGTHRGLAIAADGRHFAHRVGAGDVILIREAERGEITRRLDLRAALAGTRLGEVDAMAFHPKGRHFAMAAGRDIVVVDLDSGALVDRVAGHVGAVLSLAYSPDGRRLASGADDRSVRIWDAATRAPLVSLRGHGDQVQTLRWSADGERLYSASGDYCVRIWDTRSTGERLAGE